MRPTRRTLLLASVPLLLSGCGFALRQAPQFGFRSLYLALPAHSALALELRRQLEGSGNLQVFTDAAQRDKAEVVLESPGEQRERAVVSVSAGGEVREFQLRQRFTFRASTPPTGASCCRWRKSCARSTRATANRPRCPRNRRR